MLSRCGEDNTTRPPHARCSPIVSYCTKTFWLSLAPPGRNLTPWHVAPDLLLPHARASAPLAKHEAYVDKTFV